MQRDYAIAISATLIGVFGLLSSALVFVYWWLDRSAMFQAGGHPVLLAVFAVLGCASAVALRSGAKRLNRLER